MVEPIDDRQQCEVKDRTEHYISLAEGVFARHFETVPVAFDLKGRAAGMFKAVGKQRVIRYNPWIFAKYYQENLRDTVPHEVAHYIVHAAYGRRMKPHGKQWRALMAHFGANPEVTFTLDLTGIPTRSQMTHSYLCHCRAHDVSSTRHNRVQRGTSRYHCRYCDGELVHAP